MLKKYAKLYMHFSAQSLKVLMEYKMDFFIGLLGFVATQTIGIILLSIIFSKIPILNGWSYNQALFIYAFSQIPRGLDHLTTDNLWIFSRRIISRGQFDKYLLKPINPLFHLISEKLQTDALGELLVGFIIMFYAIKQLNITITLFNVILFIVITICGAIIYTSIKLFFASMAFWIRKSQSILSVFYSLSDFAKYPISIYSILIRCIITFVVPFAFTAYFPAAYFVNKENFLSGVVGTIAAAFLSACISYYIWCRGIDVYEDSGN